MSHYKIKLVSASQSGDRHTFVFSNGTRRKVRITGSGVSDFDALCSALPQLTRGFSGIQLPAELAQALNHVDAGRGVTTYRLNFRSPAGIRQVRLEEKATKSCRVSLGVKAVLIAINLCN